MGQSTEMPPLVSIAFLRFLNPLKFFKELLNILFTMLILITR